MSEHPEPTFVDPPVRAERLRERPSRRPPRSRPGISPAMALLPLRLFLGVTFVYAGVQKLSDPGFLHKGAPTYIGTQLHGFASHTPGGFILRTFAIPHAELAGVGVAIVEIMIGLLATFGLFTRWAAVGGMGLNLLLFLTASWHTSPYFLGPDIVFTFAWLPFVLSGASGQPALDNALEHPSERLVRSTRLQPADRGGSSLTRRALLAEIGAGALALAGVAALLKGSYKGPTLSSNAKLGGASQGGQAGSSGGSAGASSGTGAKSGGSGSSAPSIPSNAVKLGPSNRLPAGQAAEYQDPSDGSPDILIRESDGSLKAFSAVCTHAGCTVSYSSGEIVCPCHGGVYSAQTGAVVSGPPPAPLAPKKILEQSGQIYAVPS